MKKTYLLIVCISLLPITMHAFQKPATPSLKELFQHITDKHENTHNEITIEVMIKELTDYAQQLEDIAHLQDHELVIGIAKLETILALPEYKNMLNHFAMLREFYNTKGISRLHTDRYQFEQASKKIAQAKETIKTRLGLSKITKSTKKETMLSRLHLDRFLLFAPFE